VAQACAHLKGIRTEEPPLDAQRDILLAHYDEMLSLYGINNGVRVARKHIGWYSSGLPDGAAFRHGVNRMVEPEPVKQAIVEFYDALLQKGVTQRAHIAVTDGE
jgi:tRNA-dihydrouridine synthase B